MEKGYPAASACFFQMASLCYLLVALLSSDSTVTGAQPELTRLEEPFTSGSVEHFSFHTGEELVDEALSQEPFQPYLPLFHSPLIYSR